MNFNQIGRWHIHILLKDVKNKELFISNEDISKIWKIGFTQTKRVKRKKLYDFTKEAEAPKTSGANDKKDGAGAGDKTRAEDKDEEDDEDENNDEEDDIDILVNYMAKDSQLNGNIPKDVRLFGSSRGILRPQIQRMTNREAKEMMRSKGMHFTESNTIIIKNEETDRIINTHYTEVYKKKK